MGTAAAQAAGHPETANQWWGLCRFGGYAAWGIAVLLIGEVGVYATWPRPDSVVEHFAVFDDNWLVGLLTLDLLGMIAYLLFVPTVLALYVCLRRAGQAVMLVATVVFLIGIAEFYATNTAFSVLDLSTRYAAAGTETERAALVAAGQAMISMFNENAFLVSYVLVSGAILAISCVMLRSSVFGRVAGWAGVLAGASGVIAVLTEHVSPVPAVITVAIGWYFAAIIFMLIWVLVVGHRLLHMTANLNPGAAHSPPSTHSNSRHWPMTHPQD